MKIRSIENVQFRKIDKDSRVVEFVASDGSVDSYGTVLPPDKWDLSRFQKNGVIGYQHTLSYSSNPDDIIGKGVAFIEDDQLIVRVEFEPADINEKAEKVFRKIQFGSIRAVSVGFRGNDGHWGDKSKGEREDVFYYDGMTLLEVSVVNIPANDNAMKRAMDEEMATLPKRCWPGEPGEPGPQAPPMKENSAEVFSEDDMCLTMAGAALALAENLE